VLEPGRGEDAVPSAARVEGCMPDAGGRGRAAAPASGRGLAVPGLFGRNDARKRLLPFRRVCG